MAFRTTLLAGLFLLLFAAFVRAEEGEEAAGKAGEGGEIDLFLEYATEEDVGDVRVVSGSGRIHVAYGDFDLTIRKGGVVLWVDREKWTRLTRGGGGQPAEGAEANPVAALGEVIHEIYAEGGVTLRRGKDLVRAERLYYDYRRNRALITDARVIFEHYDPNEELRIPLSVKAKRLRQVAKGTFVADEASVATSLFAEPPHELTVERLRLERSEKSMSFEAEDTVFRLAGIPVLWLPWIGFSTEGGIEPLRGIDVGGTNRYGVFLGIELGTSIFLDPADELPWGKWSVEPVYRWKRGFGLGGNLEYGTSDYHGRFRAFYQHDKQERDFSTDWLIPDPDRGRVRLQHQHTLSEDFLGGTLSAIGEISWISDEGYLFEYYPQEALEGKAQETVAYLKWASGSHVSTLFGRWRINDFQNQTEYLPAFTYDFMNLPLSSRTSPIGLHVTAESHLSKLERLYAEGTPEEGDGTLTDRLLARGKVTTPFNLGPVRFTPGFVAGATAYRGGQDLDRIDLAASIRADLDFWRVWPEVRNATFALNGLKHVVDVSLKWANRYRVSAGSDEIVVQDPYDQLDKMHSVDLRIRNRLLTKRAGAVVDWIDFELRGIYFPDRLPARASPFEPRDQWALGITSLLLPEEERWRAIEREGMGPLLADLRIRLREDLFLISDVWYDFETKKFETYSTGVRYEPGPDLSLFFGHRAIEGDSSVLTGYVDFQLTRRWGFRLFEQVDLQGRTDLNAGIQVRRTAHDFVFKLTYQRNFVGNNDSLSFALEPVFLFRRDRQRETDQLKWGEMRWYR